MEIILRRHAMTAGNRRKEYIGSTDEPLCAEGELLARRCGDGPDAGVARIYCSPMRRAVRTGRIFYPAAEVVLVPALREMDFGAFERKNYEDLAGDPSYQEWLDTNCQAPCPGGESMEQFARRVCRGFEGLLEQAARRGEERVIIVAHGGTLMAVMGAYAVPKRGYFEWQTPNCGGYAGRWDAAGKQLLDWRPLVLGGGK